MDYNALHKFPFWLEAPATLCLVFLGPWKQSISVWPVTSGNLWGPRQAFLKTMWNRGFFLGGLWDMETQSHLWDVSLAWRMYIHGDAMGKLAGGTGFLIRKWVPEWARNLEVPLSQWGLRRSHRFSFFLYLHLLSAEFIPVPWVFVSSVYSGSPFTPVHPPLLAVEQFVAFQWRLSKGDREAHVWGNPALSSVSSSENAGFSVPLSVFSDYRLCI